MLTGKLWPAHPRPLPGEALSSWLIRCAHANGMKAQTFAVRNFGHERQIWNRDIDRLAPDWLLQIMSERTGTPLVQVQKMTALLFEGRFFELNMPAASYVGCCRLGCTTALSEILAYSIAHNAWQKMRSRIFA